MARTIDLNCDMGEGWGVYELGDDAAMLDIVSTANVACGFHAGDPMVMHRTMSWARERGVAVGAHPSFMDLWGFGRRPLHHEDPEEVERHLIYQIGAAAAMARAVGWPLVHVKTHGSLGNQAAVDPELAAACVRAVQAVDPALTFVTLPYSETYKAAEAAGLRIACEVFADRTYDDEGRLTSRKLPGAVIHDAAQAAERVLQMIEEGVLVTSGGRRLPVRADTVCVHGDTPGAVEMAHKIRDRLERAGVSIAPFAATG